MGTRRKSTGEQAADYTLYVYYVHKFEYVLFFNLVYCLWNDSANST